jgi:hypothetical protein
LFEMIIFALINGSRTSLIRFRTLINLNVIFG